MAGESSRNQAIARTARLLADLLRGGRHTRQSAASLLGVKPSTAARQLEALEDNIPHLRAQPTKRGKVYFFDPTTASDNRVSLGTAISACFGSSLAPLFEGTTYASDMRKATRSVVDRAVRANDFRDIDRKFLFHPRGGEVALRGEDEHFSELIEAVLTCRWVRIEYQRFVGKIDKLDIRPLSVLVHEHQLYVLADSDETELHPYRLSRIRRADVSTRRFQYPDKGTFSPSQIFRDSIGVFLGDTYPIADVRVRLSPDWRTYVETHCWHPSQRHDVDERGVVVHLRVRLCPELERWVLAFGEAAEVLAPDALRDKIAERVKNAAARYAEGVAAQR